MNPIRRKRTLEGQYYNLVNQRTSLVILETDKVVNHSEGVSIKYFYMSLCII